MNTPHRVVIIGAGYAGLLAALRLKWPSQAQMRSV
jgi:NADH dehydrogenase FAD-containing subunit